MVWRLAGSGNFTFTSDGERRNIYKMMVEKSFFESGNNVRLRRQDDNIKKTLSNK